MSGVGRISSQVILLFLNPLLRLFTLLVLCPDGLKKCPSTILGQGQREGLIKITPPFHQVRGWVQSAKSLVHAANGCPVPSSILFTKPYGSRVMVPPHISGGKMGQLRRTNGQQR